MRLDISDISSKPNNKKQIELALNINSVDDNGEVIKFNTPVDFLGYIMNKDDLIVLDGSIKTELILKCSRCLEDFTYPINLNVYEEFLLRPNYDDIDDKIILKNDYIDLEQVVESNILMSLPIKRLCKNDCKGLCQCCGTNLNFSTCNCEKRDIDPRLAMLKELL